MAQAVGPEFKSSSPSIYRKKKKKKIVNILNAKAHNSLPLLDKGLRECRNNFFWVLRWRGKGETGKNLIHVVQDILFQG
jgi:hypothetical protein